MSESKPPLSQRMARIFRLGNPDDPLTSLKAATRWTDTLVVGNPLKAHAQLLAEVKRFNDSPSEGLSRERLMIVMTLDEKGQDLQQSLARQYLRNPRMSRMMESELWHAIFQFNWEILRAYHSFILAYFRNPGNAKFKALIPIVLLRSLRGFRHVIKWRSIRYMHPGEKTWLRLHQLYQLAEKNDFHKTRLQAYPDDRAECTCESEYVHTLMLDQANSGSLYPRQIDLIDQWLQAWSDQLTFDSTLNIERHVLAVDMTRDRGARRVRQSGPELSTRFWSTLDLLNQLGNIQADIHAGAAPARLGLTENIRTAEALDLLQHLARQWSPLTSREQRRRPRVAIKRAVEVVHGFHTIFSHVSAHLDEEASQNTAADRIMFDEAEDMQIYGFVTERTKERATASAPNRTTDPHDVERWIMENESELGFGTTIQTRDKDWLRVGVLVGIRTKPDEAWSIGIIRRLSRLSDSESSVGIELLPGKPYDAFLSSDESRSGYMVDGHDSGNGSSATGLILNEGNQPIIVLDPAHYQRKASMKYASSHGRQTIQLGDAVEQGDGWVISRISWIR